MIRDKILEKISNHGKANLMVNCSGGADSALMLFETCKIIVENKLPATIVVFTLTADARDRYNSRCAQNVINVIARQLDNYPIISHQIFYAPVQESEYFKKWEPQVIKNFDINLRLNATSLTPPKGTVVLDSNGLSRNLYRESLSFERRNLSPNLIKDGLEIIFPYYNLHKVDILKKYHQYNLIDTLLPVTRSCELPVQGYTTSARTDVIDDITKTCGTCWWCLERKWAINATKN